MTWILLTWYCWSRFDSNVDDADADDDDDDDVDDEVHHAASAASTGAAKEDDLLLPPTHQLLHSLPKREEYYRKTGYMSTWQACDPWIVECYVLGSEKPDIIDFHR